LFKLLFPASSNNVYILCGKSPSSPSSSPYPRIQRYNKVAYIYMAVVIIIVSTITSIIILWDNNTDVGELSVQRDTKKVVEYF